MTADLRPVEAALLYARRGWPVFPCHHPVARGCSCGSRSCSSPAKHPLTRHGLRDATTSEEAIRRWWRTWPQANVAVRTGALPGRLAPGLVVLDVDPAHGGDATLHDLVTRVGGLPDTRTVETGGGGQHLYFAHPGGDIRNSAGTRLGPGLDVRADGGYVVAPPSRHASGGTYEWGPVPAVAALPEWLHARLVAERQEPRRELAVGDLRHDRGVTAWAASALRQELQRVVTAPVGQRNHTLNRSAFLLGQIAGGGHLSVAQVADLLQQAGEASGLGATETRATIASGLTAGSQLPRHPAERQPAPARTAPLDRGARAERTVELPQPTNEVPQRPTGRRSSTRSSPSADLPL